MAMAIFGNLIVCQQVVILIGAVNKNIAPAHELDAVVLGWTKLFLSKLLDGGFDFLDMPFS